MWLSNYAFKVCGCLLLNDTVHFKFDTEKIDAYNLQFRGYKFEFDIGVTDKCDLVKNSEVHVWKGHSPVFNY